MTTVDTIGTSLEYPDDRPIIYVAGPMSAPTAWDWELNIRKAEEIGLELVGRGCAPIVPQTMGRFFRGTHSREVWMSVDFSLLSRCDGLLAIPGWMKSEGSKSEVAYARANDIPVFSLAGNNQFLIDWIAGLKRRV